jgi:magnesium transporter
VTTTGRHVAGGPGAAPGVEHDEIVALTGTSGGIRVTCIDYSPGELLVQDVDDLKEFLGHHRPSWSVVRWINAEGLGDMDVIHALATKYELHPLAVEDILDVSQRPKVEFYGGEDSDLRARLFIVARALQVSEGELLHEQVSMFLGHATILTFQERASAMWEPIRQRLKVRSSRLRGSDASFLAYSLLDTIVDRCYPILEEYGDRAEELETRILERSQRDTINEVHQLKRDLLLLRRIVWPLREVVSRLRREPHECVSDTTRIYLNDLYDHVVQIIDIVETYREIATALTETYMSSVSNRMNEIVKVLTIIGTIFIPLTFLAGVYGMNFHYFPELDQQWAYPAFWVVCIAVAGIMLVVFRRRDWI